MSTNHTLDIPTMWTARNIDPIISEKELCVYQFSACETLHDKHDQLIRMKHFNYIKYMIFLIAKFYFEEYKYVFIFFIVVDKSIYIDISVI